jgi:hypothetical protein
MMLRFDPHSRIPLFQNVMAAGVFCVAASGNVLANLLHHYPDSVFLWQVSVPVNRAVMPLTQAIDALSPVPLFAFALMLVTLGLPLLAYKRSSWLGTAAASHLALAVAVMMTLNLADVELRQKLTAENLLTINPEHLDDRVIGFGAIAVAMLLLCVLNHMAFFRLRPRRVRG